MPTSLTMSDAEVRITTTPCRARRTSPGAGLWCLVAGQPELIAADASRGATMWINPAAHDQLIVAVLAHPERIHPTYEAALAFVRSELGWE